MIDVIYITNLNVAKCLTNILQVPTGHIPNYIKDKTGSLLPQSLFTTIINVLGDCSEVWRDRNSKISNQYKYEHVNYSSGIRGRDYLQVWNEEIEQVTHASIRDYRNRNYINIF